MRVIMLWCGLLWLAGCGGQKSLVEETIPTNYENESAYLAGPVTDCNAFADNERELSYTAYYRLKSEESEEIQPKLTRLVEDYDGFILEATKSKLVFRLRSEFLNEAVLAVEDLGEVVDKKIMGNDVTDLFHDLSLRLENARNVLQRYQQLVLMEQSASGLQELEQKIQLQLALIEKLEGQLYKIEHTVQYTTFTVETSPKAKAGPLGVVIGKTFNVLKSLFIH